MEAGGSDDFLRLVLFQKNIAAPRVKLTDDRQRAYLSFLIGDRRMYGESVHLEFGDRYEAVKKYIPVLFRYVLNRRVDSSWFELMAHGRSYGHREKLRKAYEDCMLVIPQRADYYGMKDEKIMDRIYRLRTDIVHKGDAIKFSSFDISCLEKLQWITYLLLLREIGIEDQDLENWMNRVMGVG